MAAAAPASAQAAGATARGPAPAAPAPALSPAGTLDSGADADDDAAPPPASDPRRRKKGWSNGKPRTSLSTRPGQAAAGKGVQRSAAARPRSPPTGRRGRSAGLPAAIQPRAAEQVHPRKVTRSQALHAAKAAEHQSLPQAAAPHREPPQPPVLPDGTDLRQAKNLTGAPEGGVLTTGSPIGSHTASEQPRNAAAGRRSGAAGEAASLPGQLAGRAAQPIGKKPSQRKKAAAQKAAAAARSANPGHAAADAAPEAKQPSRGRSGAVPVPAPAAPGHAPPSQPASSTQQRPPPAGKTRHAAAAAAAAAEPASLAALQARLRGEPSAAQQPASLKRKQPGRSAKPTSLAEGRPPSLAKRARRGGGATTRSQGAAVAPAEVITLSVWPPTLAAVSLANLARSSGRPQRSLSFVLPLSSSCVPRLSQLSPAAASCGELGAVLRLAAAQLVVLFAAVFFMCPSCCLSSKC